MKKIIYILATGFYAGKCPIAPGTAGTLVGVLFYLLLRYLPDAVYIPTVIAFIFLAAWVATQAQEIFGLQDPPEIVIDEIAGFEVTREVLLVTVDLCCDIIILLKLITYFLNYIFLC